MVWTCAQATNRKAAERNPIGNSRGRAKPEKTNARVVHCTMYEYKGRLGLGHRNSARYGRLEAPCRRNGSQTLQEKGTEYNRVKYELYFNYVLLTYVISQYVL